LLYVIFVYESYVIFYIHEGLSRSQK